MGVGADAPAYTAGLPSNWRVPGCQASPRERWACLEEAQGASSSLRNFPGGSRRTSLVLKSLAPQPSLPVPHPVRGPGHLSFPALMDAWESHPPSRDHTPASCPAAPCPQPSVWGARLLWLESGWGCWERGQDFLSSHGHCPPGQRGTESLNYSPNVNNLKIFLFNCFPCPAWGRLGWPARGRGRRPPGSSAASWAVNHGPAPPPPLRSRL